MKLTNQNILVVPSQKYEGYYSFKKYLMDIYPGQRAFVVPTKLKGIGKSYSIWNEIIIPDINNDKLGTIYIRWGATELNGIVSTLKNKPMELTDKLNCEVEWNVTQGVTILRNAETKQELIYFVTPSQFKVLKGITIDGNLPIKNVFWEEFLIPDNIYRKPEEALDSYFQLLGSMFRTQDFWQFMSANNVNPDNPFLWHIFTEMGWPNYGETIIDTDSGWVIDSPVMNDFIKEKYSDSTFFRITKVKPTIHNQLFGDATLYDSMYSNQDLIKYRVDEDCDYKFSFRLKTVVFHCLTYLDPEFNEYRMYITPQKIPCNINEYAGDAMTAIEITKPLIPGHILRSMLSYAKEGKMYFRDKRTLDLFIWMVTVNSRQQIKPLDWKKKDKN